MATALCGRAVAAEEVTPTMGESAPASSMSNPGYSTDATASGEDGAFAAVVASVERLDELGLATEAGLATVEPATTFRLG